LYFPRFSQTLLLIKGSHPINLGSEYYSQLRRISGLEHFGEVFPSPCQEVALDSEAPWWAVSRNFLILRDPKRTQLVLI
ncbi:hypothetical protein LEMLEM_LOCUS7826, partial [Lemmus lemmus]